MQALTPKIKFTSTELGAELTGLVQVPAALGVGEKAAKNLLKEGMIAKILCDGNVASVTIYEN